MPQEGFEIAFRHPHRGQHRAIGAGIGLQRADGETYTRERGRRIEVADHGPGIGPRRLEKIWKSFFTTKRHGTGLGLYITRKVIEDQGGSISVESEVGRGTRFTITLPLD